MAEIRIGEVSFNKKDVARTETAQKDGQTINTVFLTDGTKLSYPPQNPENKASVSVFDLQKEAGSVTRALTKLVTQSGDAEVTFNKLDNAEISGTEQQDRYILNGCRDTKVDISQNDGEKDRVIIKDSKPLFGEKRTSSNIDVSTGANDVVER